VQDTLGGADQRIIPHHQVGHQEGQQPPHPLQGQQPGDGQQRGPQQNADQHGAALTRLAFPMVMAAAAAVLMAMFMMIVMVLMLVFMLVVMVMLVLVTHGIASCR